MKLGGHLKDGGNTCENYSKKSHKQILWNFRIRNNSKKSKKATGPDNEQAEEI